MSQDSSTIYIGHDRPAFYKNPEKTGYVWDCLAALYIIDPSFVTDSEIMHLDIITHPGQAFGGVTAFRKGRKPGKYVQEVRVMLNLDTNKFFKLYKKLLSAPL